MSGKEFLCTVLYLQLFQHLSGLTGAFLSHLWDPSHIATYKCTGNSLEICSPEVVVRSFLENHVCQRGQDLGFTFLSSGLLLFCIRCTQRYFHAKEHCAGGQQRGLGRSSLCNQNNIEMKLNFRKHSTSISFVNRKKFCPSVQLSL